MFKRREGCQGVHATICDKVASAEVQEGEASEGLEYLQDLQTKPSIE